MGIAKVTVCKYKEVKNARSIREGSVEIVRMILHSSSPPFFKRAESKF